MLRLARSRVLGGLLTLVVVAALILVATVALPGDAAVAVLGKTATPESLSAFRAEHHLNDPVFVQFVRWIGGVLRGDLGESVVSGESVRELLTTHGARTLTLMVLAMVIGFPLGILLGIVAALRRNGVFDHAMSVALLVVTGIPEFALAVLAVLALSTNLFHWFPAVSLLRTDESIFTQLDVLVLPVLTLVVTILPYITLTIRSSMIEVLESDFVAMARLKGIAESRVILRHTLPNASGPLIQVLAVTLVYLAGGAVIVETVFQFPGLGSGLVDAVRNRDLVMIQSTTLVLAVVYVAANVLADLAVVATTPRFRTQVAR